MVSGEGEARPVRVTLAPTDESFPRGSSAWNDELNDLYREVDLDRELTDAIERTPGSRGDPITLGLIAMTLVTSGTVTALLGCVKAWIQQHPGRRTVDMTVTVGQKEQRIVLDSRNIDDASLQALLRGAVKSGG